jgi:hypothetical protein
MTLTRQLLQDHERRSRLSRKWSQGASCQKAWVPDPELSDLATPCICIRRTGDPQHTGGALP